MISYFEVVYFFITILNSLLGLHNELTLTNFLSSNFHSLKWVVVLHENCQNT